MSTSLPPSLKPPVIREYCATRDGALSHHDHAERLCVECEAVERSLALSIESRRPVPEPADRITQLLDDLIALLAGVALEDDRRRSRQLRRRVA